MSNVRDVGPLPAVEELERGTSPAVFQIMQLYFAQGLSAAATAACIGQSPKYVRDRVLRVQTRFPRARQLRFPELRGFGAERDPISIMLARGIAPVRSHVTGLGMA